MKKSVLLFLLWLTFTSCHHELPELALPAKTTEGKNTFGCLLNNKVWRNYGKRCYTFGCEPENLRSEVYKNLAGTVEFTIHASYSVGRPHRINQQFRIIVQDFKGEGVYDLADDHIQFDAEDHYTWYRSEGRNTAFCHVTKYDTIRQIISGEFYGVLPSTKTNISDEVEIREGRFDLVYNKVN